MCYADVVSAFIKLLPPSLAAPCLLFASLSSTPARSGEVQSLVRPQTSVGEWMTREELAQGHAALPMPVGADGGRRRPLLWTELAVSSAGVSG